MPCIILIHYLEFAIFAIFTYCHFNLHKGAEWVGSFLKNFQKGGEGGAQKPSEVSMIFYVVFVATELARS